MVLPHADSTYRLHRLRPLSQAEALDSAARAAEFERISERGGWGAATGEPDGDKDTVSGGGSFLSATESARQCLGAWLKKYEIRGLLDVPCGDALWQGTIPGINGVRYVGADISRPALIRAMGRARNQDADMSFRWMDVTTEVIDGSKYQAVMFRDFLQHLDLNNGARAIENARKGGVRFLIASTFPKTAGNSLDLDDIGGGVSRLAPSHPNNLRLPPYNLPAPLEDCENHVGLGDGSRLQLFELQV
jgi:hypothetical protein